MTSASGRPGLLVSAKAALGTTLTLLQTRLMLLATELEEERQRLISLLLWGAIAVLGLGAGLVFLAIFLTVLLWDSHRLLVLAVFSVIFLLGGVFAALLVKRLAAMSSGIFAASLAELSQDRAALRQPPEAS